MPRVFLCLAISNLLLLAMNAVLGLWGEPMRDRHIVLGVLTLIYTCFLQVMAFTYFTITGKMIGQALNVANADLEPLIRSKGLKLLFTRWLAILFLAAAATSASGAMRWRGYGPANLHLATAGLAVVLHILVLFRQYVLVTANAAVFENVFRARPGP